MRRWSAAGYDLKDDQALAIALLKNRRTPPRVRAKALQIRASFRPESAEEDAKVAIVLEKTSLGMVEDLEREAARYLRMQQKAEVAGDMTVAEMALDSRMKVYRTLIGIRKDLKRLGEDSAKLISRGEVERIIAAMGAQASLAIGRMLRRLGTALLGQTRVEQVVAILEPDLMRGLFLEPFASAGSVAAGNGLPSWVIDSFRRACGDAVENGEGEFDAVNIDAGLGQASCETGPGEIQSRAIPAA